MIRITQLIEEITTACRSAVTVRDAVSVAARRFVDLFPGSSIVLFEREPDRDAVRAVAGVNIPAAWQLGAIHTIEVPLLDQALREPTRLLEGVAGSGQPLDGAAPLHVICGALPGPLARAYVLMFLLAPAAPGEETVRENAVEALRQAVIAGDFRSSDGPGQSRALTSILHAKLEWEQMADALPEIVGLLDGLGRIVRVSRAVERWGLGEVRGAIGRDLHATLHPGCGQPDCALAVALAAAWHEFLSASSAKIDYEDPLSDLALTVEFRPAGQEFRPTLDATWQRIAFVVTNVTALRHAERDLTLANRTLEARVAERTSRITTANRVLRAEVARRKKAEQALRASQTELEGLSEQLMSAQEEERSRIAQDLHDSVGQSLSAIKYSLEAAEVLARRGDTAQARDAVRATIERVQRVMDEVRGISMNLRPAILDGLGAASAVRWFCREWHDVYRDVAIDIDISVSDDDIPPLLGTSVFRAVQESLNNIARHAQARQVRVAIRLHAGAVRVTVADDGVGFSLEEDANGSASKPAAYRLRGLRKRAERNGGRCHIASSPGAGTTVSLEWPLAADLAAAQATPALSY